MSSNRYHALTHVPPKGAPLLFAFHGTGGDEQQFFHLAREIAPHAGVISPRGDVEERGAARFFKRTGEGVYDKADLTIRTVRMATFVAAHKAMHPNSSLYAFGYSNGANILASVVMARPDLFARIGLLHPLIPWAPNPAPLDGRRVLITAGRRDPICPLPESEKLIGWFKQQGADVQTQIQGGGHQLRQSEITALAGLFVA